MTIDVSSKSSLVKFSEIEYGDVFKYLNCNFLKVYDPYKNVNAILLDSKSFQCFYVGKDTEVYKAKEANLSIKF